LSPILQASIAFALIIASAAAGAFLRLKLPEHHLTGDSKDVIKLAVALIATMSALVLALLFASTRTSFERTSGYVSRMTADVTELDKLLGEYGPEAKPLRVALRAEVAPLINSIWQEDAPAQSSSASAKGHGDSVLYMLRELAPTNKVQASIQARALQVSTDLNQTQLSLISQPSDSISNTFIIVLVIWLMFIFAVFSMSSPPNPTLFAVLFLCILSASAAIYLILELGLPFDGLMQVSPENLRAALKPLS
jgi:hypothetical protein